MILEHYYLGCLSQASYLLGDEDAGVAIVVDPRRDSDIYIEEAQRLGVRIIGIVNTHFHADFIAGHLELAAAAGAWIGYGARAEADYPIRRLADGERIRLGEVEVEVLETPGHTWESISLLVRRGDAPEPVAVLTGDALFNGDVGRPDLAAAVGADPAELAHAQFHSIHDVLLALPDATSVLPAHGAGSACGKAIGRELISTIGEQRRHNWAARITDEDAFVAELQTGQPPAPRYFAEDAVLNRRRHLLWSADRQLPLLGEREVRSGIAAGFVVLDCRASSLFALGHLPGSVNIGLDGRFAETAGCLLRLDEPLLLLAPAGREREAADRLARVGFDSLVGLVDPEAFVQLGDLVLATERLSAAEFDRLADTEEVVLLDVRTAGERAAAGVVDGTRHIPLADLSARHAELPFDAPIAVHCAAGYRSSAAASMLRRLGHADVTDLDGGFAAWRELHPRAA
ncbi:MAG: MBL fold metallo-hydrolase [Microbacteriaceae bacterium]